jgi:predicted nuclease of predicted toxin-antitoxin system
VNIKLLLDANLSWRLVKLLQNDFPRTEHVDFCKLKVPSKDKEIWEYARLNEFIIITNDEDFYEYAVYYGFPPYAVLLRMGNQSTKFIFDTIIQHKEKIINLISSTEIGLLEIY